MLWAIDIGNTQMAAGVHDGSDWIHVWRLDTDHNRTEDELAVHFKSLCDLEGIEFEASGAAISSVVPSLNTAVESFCRDRLSVEPLIIRTGDEVGLPVTCHPPTAVGADRIANAVGAIDKWGTPVIIVDFGTATTFDVIDETGAYIGGSILPGVEISAEALSEKAAKLPSISLRVPEKAIGTTTIESLESGIVLGTAAAIDGLAKQIVGELGGEPKIVATGGLGAVFAKACDAIELYDANLTLDGLKLCWDRTRV